MNIASFLQPKAEVTFLRDDMTLRQGLGILHQSGFTAVPVVDIEDRYVGVVSEGDFLWNTIAGETPDTVAAESLEESLEDRKVRDILQGGKVRAVCIDTAMEDLLERAKHQNFVPVIDDRSVFIGIITRSDIIKYFCDR